MWGKGIWFLAGSVVAGLAVGWSTGRPPAPGQPVGGNTPTPREASRPAWAKDDFLKAANDRAREAVAGKVDLHREFLSDWTDDEIRTALDASMTHPDCVLADGASAGLSGALLGEWMRRDFEAALGWFEALGSEAAKQRLALALSQKWPTEKATEGLVFLRKNLALFAGGKGWALIERSLMHAAESGPDAVNAILKLCREEQLHGGRAFPFQFPEAFDFPGLLAGPEWQQLEDDSLTQGIVHAWHSREPDPAFDWLLEQGGPRSLKMLADNVMGPSGNSAKWLAEKVEGLPDDLRHEFLSAAGDEWISMPSKMGAFARGLKDPEALEEVGGWGARAMYRDVESGLAIVESIPDPERRIALLESAEPDERLAQSPAFRTFDSHDEALLRQKLAEWKAGDERIESIVSRYKP